MRPLADDIVRYIHEQFPAGEVSAVLSLLDRHAEALSTPRVLRSVLFLSGGSLAMLRHYVATAELDVREILTQAEYTVDLADEPLPVRTMSQPFGAPQIQETRTIRPIAAVRSPRRGSSRTATRYHAHLVGGRFALGNAEYMVTTEQENADCVRCLRRANDVVSVVHLPLVFVLEQLSSEHIELNEMPSEGWARPGGHSYAGK